MNTIELSAALRRNPKWMKFAEKLSKAMAEDYGLDGVTVVLRELTAEESREDGEALTFNQTSQQFEFAIAPGEDLPAAWKIADRIDQFLNPDSEGEA